MSRDYMTRSEWDRLLVLLSGIPAVVDWSPPKGERIGGVPPWQGGRLLERTGEFGVYAWAKP